MPIVQFPDPSTASEEGVLAIGGDLDPESLLLAYRKGIFPWPVIDFPLMTWFCPKERAILDFSDLHVPRSLSKAMKKTKLTFTFDKAFSEVVIECALMPRPNQPGTWISDEVIAAYNEFHRLGYAHSFEVWVGKKLVGGLYGVSVDGTFAGESMFHKTDNASKYALLYTIDYLRSKGLTWIDIQVMTPHMKSLGAKLISRESFLHRLAQTQALGLKLF